MTTTVEIQKFMEDYKDFNPNTLRMQLVMRTASGVELFHNPETDVYMSEDMDAVIAALKEDMESSNSQDVAMATALFERLQNANIYNEC